MIVKKPYTNKQYADLAVYCNENGMVILDSGDFLESVYPPAPSEEEIKKERAAELHRLLEEADYWTSKYCDGEYTAEEWAEKVAIRKAWREELRTLETEE